MTSPDKNKTPVSRIGLLRALIIAIVLCNLLLFEMYSIHAKSTTIQPDSTSLLAADSQKKECQSRYLETVKYNRLLLHMVHGMPSRGWPVNAPYPLPEHQYPPRGPDRYEYGWVWLACKKIDSYIGAIVHEPAQFTGFKLFYRYYISKGFSKIMQPEDVLKLYPAPIYIQYQ